MYIYRVNTIKGCIIFGTNKEAAENMVKWWKQRSINATLERVLVDEDLENSAN